MRAANQIEQLINTELSYMNTNHPEFIGFHKYDGMLGCWGRYSRR
jgi:hypothetical protein